MSSQMPSDWSEQLQAVYPKRSGPSGWRSMKLMLALRRALFDSTWEQIIDGCKNYAKYCDQGGKTGSEYVQAPLRFIQDGSYLESFTFQSAQDPKVTEAKRKEAERMARVIDAARALDPPLTPYPQEPAAAFETRVRLAQTSRIQPLAVRSGIEGDSAPLASRIASLTERMRIAK